MGTKERVKSDALKRLRTARGWTQMQLAVELGCSLSTLFQCEQKGELPSRAGQLEKIKKLCEESGVQI